LRPARKIQIEGVFRHQVRLLAPEKAATGQIVDRLVGRLRREGAWADRRAFDDG
jgi:hypothetical protein